MGNEGVRLERAKSSERKLEKNGDGYIIVIECMDRFGIIKNPSGSS